MTHSPRHHLDACNTSPAGGSDHISAARFGAFVDVLSLTAVRTA
jgi:hypothetical protein